MWQVVPFTCLLSVSSLVALHKGIKVDMLSASSHWLMYILLPTSSLPPTFSQSSWRLWSTKGAIYHVLPDFTLLHFPCQVNVHLYGFQLYPLMRFPFDTTRTGHAQVQLWSVVHLDSTNKRNSLGSWWPGKSRKSTPVLFSYLPLVTEVADIGT